MWKRYFQELPWGKVVLQDRGYDGKCDYWVAIRLPFSAEGLAHVDSVFRSSG